jgi:hypothetical protein
MRTSSSKMPLSAFITTLHSVEGNRSGDITVNVTEITVIFILQQRCYLPVTATRICSEIGEWNSRCRRKTMLKSHCVVAKLRVDTIMLLPSTFQSE